MTTSLQLVVGWLEAIPLDALEAGARDAGIAEPFCLLATLRQQLREQEHRDEPAQQRDEHDEQECVA